MTATKKSSPSITEEIKQLQECAARLQSLLVDPQLGMASWWSGVATVNSELQSKLAALGVYPLTR